MQIINCEQGTAEWKEAKLGIPSASCFEKILSPTGKPSTQANTYMHQLLADMMIGCPEESYKSEAMQHGNDTEDEARAFFEFKKGLTVEQVGFCKIENAGCSPDGLIGDHSGIEIKCPNRSTHVGYLLDNKLPTKYIPQVQGSMYVTGRNHWYFMSYHQELPPLIVEVQRDNNWIDSFIVELDKFTKKLNECNQQLLEVA